MRDESMGLFILGLIIGFFVGLAADDFYIQSQR